MRKQGPPLWRFLRSWVFPGLVLHEPLLEGASFSGYERNHLFLNQGGRQFAEASGVSGLDGVEDGRAFALLDLDHDGFLDLAQVNSNGPVTQMFRNRLGERDRAARHQFIAVKLHGGNRTSRPMPSLSNRDGIGARVSVGAGTLSLVRELRAGEGFAAQHSATLILGIAEAPVVETLRVRWRSGRNIETSQLPAGSLVHVYEEAGQSPTGDHFVVTSYRGDAAEGVLPPPPEVVLGSRPLRLAQDVGETPRGALVLYTTLATWCTNCAAEVPALQQVREAFSPEELQMYGVPYDPADSAEALQGWAAQRNAPYQVLTQLTRPQVEQLLAVQRTELLSDALPVGVVTDSAGRVLLTRFGPPTVSELRGLLRALSGDARR